MTRSFIYFLVLFSGICAAVATRYGYGGQVNCKPGTKVYDRCRQLCICSSSGSLTNCTRLRKEFTSMSAAERRLYIRTYKKASTHPRFKPLFDKLITLHMKYFMSDIHQKIHFLTWHRWYLLQFENLLRSVNCRVTLPYWDWSICSGDPWGTDPDDIWYTGSTGFGGNGASSDQCVNTGPFAKGAWQLVPASNPNCPRREFNGYPPDAVAVAELLDIEPDNFTLFELGLRVSFHDTVHCLIGGTMCSYDSANAPEFFLHHAFVDKIWADWQSKSEYHKEVYFHDLEVPLPVTGGVMPKDVLDLNNLPGGVRVEYLDVNDTETVKFVKTIRRFSPLKLRDIPRPDFKAISTRALKLFHVNIKEASKARKEERKFRPRFVRQRLRGVKSRRDRKLGFDHRIINTMRAKVTAAARARARARAKARALAWKKARARARARARAKARARARARAKARAKAKARALARAKAKAKAIAKAKALARAKALQAAKARAKAMAIEKAKAAVTESPPQPGAAYGSPTEQPTAQQGGAYGSPTEQPTAQQGGDNANPTKQPTAQQGGAYGSPTEQPTAQQGGDNANPTKQPTEQQGGAYGSPTEQPTAQQGGAYGSPTEQPTAQQGGDNANPTKQPTEQQGGAYGSPTEQPTAQQGGAYGSPTEQPTAQQGGDNANPTEQPTAQQGGAYGSPTEQPTAQQGGDNVNPTEQPTAQQGGAYGSPTEQPTEQQGGDNSNPTEQPTAQQGGNNAKTTEQPTAQQGGDNAKTTERPTEQQGGDNANPTEQPTEQQGGDNANPTEQPTRQQGGDNANPTEQPTAQHGGDNGNPTEQPTVKFAYYSSG